VLWLSGAVLLVFGAAWSVACGDGGEGPDGSGGDGDGGPSSLPDAAVGPSEGGAPATTMRLAHLAEALGPVDFCYRTAKTSSLVGPVLSRGIGVPKRDAGNDGGDPDAGDPDAADLDAADPDAGDAGARAVAPRTVSRYLSLEAAGALTVALVEPGATSCASPLFSGDVTLDPGKLSTVAIVGVRDADASSEATLGIVAFIDDRSTVPDKARVRMVHAALGAGARAASGALAVRAVGAQTHVVAERLEPRKAAAPSTAVPVDALGYATIAPVPAPAQLAVGAATAMGSDASVESWVSAAGELALQGGSLHTGFVLTGDATPFEVLWCSDTSTAGELTSCTLVR